MPRRKMTTAERDALVMAPVGTPGLHRLGLIHPDDANADNMGETARRRAAALWSRWHMAQAADDAGALAQHMAGMSPEDKQLLLGVLTDALKGGDHGG